MHKNDETNADGIIPIMIKMIRKILIKKNFNNERNKSFLYILKALLDFVAEIIIDEVANNKVFVSQTIDLNSLINFISIQSDLSK